MDLRADIKQIMDALFLQPDCGPLVSALECVDQDCILAGLGEQSFQQGKEAVKKALCSQKDQMKGLPAHLLDAWYKEIPMGENLAMVYGCLHLSVAEGDSPNMWICVSGLFLRKETWKLTSLHLSAPWDQELPGCRWGALVRQLEETQQMLSYMSRLAEQDPVTLLYNRRTFFTMAEQLVQDKKCYMMVLDLDHFKLINDTYGHLMGDDILLQTGKAICAATREKDVVGRVGGDEFAVVCADVRDDAMAMAIARRIVKHVNEMTGKSISLPVNISVGVSRHRPENTLRETFRQADAAMYQVKRSCKNGCLLYGAETKGFPEQKMGGQDG